VLEGEAGLGGEPERDVPELRDEKVNVLRGSDFSVDEVVRAWEELLDASLGERFWLVPDFVRFSMLPIRVSKFGLCCGDEGAPFEVVPLLVLPLTFVCKGGGLMSGGCSGTERGMFAAIVAILGVLTGLVRIGGCCDSVTGVEGGGVGLVSVTAGGKFEVTMSDALELLLWLSVTTFCFCTVFSKPMSSILRGRGIGVEVSGVVVFC